jgi:formiminoglutamase
MLKHKFAWSGREDTEEIGFCQRWHQKIVPIVSPGDTAAGGVTLIGFASDEGVRRNKGRPGAAAGPEALRAALAGLPVMEEPELFDAGDVACEDGKLEEAQDRLAAAVAEIIRHKNRAIVLGGGHEVAWGTFSGITRSGTKPDRLLVINFDAHFDLRVSALANSGTPFRQMREYCADRGAPFNYRIFGISRFSNTRALFDRADEIGARYWLDEDLQSTAGLEAARQALAGDLAKCEAAYLTICLDVLPGACAPGVSAPAALGVPLAHVETLIGEVLASHRLIAADIAELNPERDRDGLTARVAARLAARMARG